MPSSQNKYGGYNSLILVKDKVSRVTTELEKFTLRQLLILSVKLEIQVKSKNKQLIAYSIVHMFPAMSYQHLKCLEGLIYHTDSAVMTDLYIRKISSRIKRHRGYRTPEWLKLLQSTSPI